MIPAPSEHAEQVALIAWWALACREFGIDESLLFAVPNGGARNPITGRRLKDEGVRRGVPDLMLAMPNDDHSGLFIELKKRNGGRVSEEQRHVLEELTRAGYKAVVCHGWEEAMQEILVYLATSRMQRRVK